MDVMGPMIVALVPRVVNVQEAAEFGQNLATGEIRTMKAVRLLFHVTLGIIV